MTEISKLIKTTLLIFLVSTSYSESKSLSIGNSSAKISVKVFCYSYIISGLLLWIFGPRDVTIIGASGTVYALGSFILFSGFIRKQPRLMMLSFLVIFLNFFNLWGLIEVKQDKISQTAHLCGVIAGIIISVLLKNEGPKPKIYDYEIEEELEKRNNINYIYKKKN